MSRGRGFMGTPSAAFQHASLKLRTASAGPPPWDNPASRRLMQIKSALARDNGRADAKLRKF